MANIMVVDDDSLVRTVLKEVLKLNNHDVVEASNGQEALDLIDPKALPDLIFMDYRMPGYSGIDCARQLKALYSSLKIVMISGHYGFDDDGYLVANKHLFTDVILKPFHIKDIDSTVDYVLGTRAEEERTLISMEQQGTTV
jgi:two-component system cell cycle response regulator CpdR